MPTIKSKKPFRQCINLLNGTSVDLVAYGTAEVSEDQMESPHLLSCKKNRMITVLKESRGTRRRKAVAPPQAEPPKTESRRSRRSSEQQESE